MTKILLNTFAGLILCSASAFSQPVITASGVNPVIGDLYTLKYCGYISPGLAGPNQTWNLSAFTPTSTTNYSVGTVASAPNSSSFSAGSNMQMNDGSVYSFINATSASYQNSGSIAGTTDIVYNNNEDLIRYPFNMSNSYTDTWSANFTNNSINFFRKGTSAVTYDGYGTLMLPTGTFLNVARIHFVQNYVDSSAFSSIIYHNDEYLWFINGHHQPIAGVFSVTVNGGSAIMSGFYSTANALATFIAKQENEISNLTCFPNPTSGILNFNLKDEVRVRNISVYDATGNLAHYTAGEARKTNTFSLNMEELPNGIYLVKLLADDGASAEKIISIRK